ncbi:MAG: dockerin type I domain-containing protein [Ruminococcus sp.]
MKLKLFKKIIPFLSSAFILMVPGIPSDTTASAERVLTGYRGDVNLDGTLSVLDAVQLQKHLLNIGTIEKETACNYADLTEDGFINCLDLAYLKHCLMDPESWIGIYEEQPDTETPFIEAPISAVNSSLPSQGDAALVIFYIDFPDCTYSNQLSEEQIQEIAFGPADSSSEYYPFESMHAFYERSSKGSMNLTGQVFSYTAQNSISAYHENKVALAEECFEAFKDSVDFSAYDKDGDGQIDATLFTVPETASEDYWWPCAGGFGDPEYTVDGVKVGHIITGNAEPSDWMNFNSSYLHEMGHCMGLPDYYLYYSEDFDSMHGPAGTEMMDADAYSDFCSFSKLMLGWYRQNQIMVYDSSVGTQTFQLCDAQTDNGNCVIIPYGNLDENYFSEYFIIEYSTENANNQAVNSLWWQEFDSGIRIHHIYAELYSDDWWTYLKYQNGSEFTGMNDEGIRLIRLVNDSGSIFKTGDVINNSTPGFGWYDSNEEESIDPGVTISIGNQTDGQYTIIISANES